MNNTGIVIWRIPSLCLKDSLPRTSSLWHQLLHSTASRSFSSRAQRVQKSWENRIPSSCSSGERWRTTIFGATYGRWSGVARHVWGFQECQKRGYATETPRFGILTEEEYAAHPLRYRDVSANQLLEIFGTKMGTDEGNEILRIIQKRRITGTLDFEDSPSESLNIARARALIWLRENYPMDEDAAIMQRFEDEDKALAEREKNWQPQANANDALYGKSQLEAIRQRNEAKYIKEQEEAAKKQEEAIRAAGGDPNVKLVTSPNGRAVLERRTESAEWVRRYKEQARLSNLAEPPYMAKSKRLLPSGVFLVAVLLGCYLLAQNYTAPPRAARLFPDIPPAAATIMSIIAINSVIIVVWRLPPLWRFMNKHFLLIPATPHVFSIVGNTFSHHKFTHLFTNMFTLWFVGTRLHDDVGRGNFLAVYLGSGALASYVSLSKFVITNNLLRSSLGASGAVCGVIACWLCLHANDDLTIAFIPESLKPIFSAAVALSVIIGLEAFMASRGGSFTIDHWAHLGGFAAGIGSSQMLLHKVSERRSFASRDSAKAEVAKKFGLRGS